MWYFVWDIPLALAWSYNFILYSVSVISLIAAGKTKVGYIVSALESGFCLGPWPYSQWQQQNFWGGGGPGRGGVNSGAPARGGGGECWETPIHLGERCKLPQIPSLSPMDLLHICQANLLTACKRLKKGAWRCSSSDYRPTSWYNPYVLQCLRFPRWYRLFPIPKSW